MTTEQQLEALEPTIRVLTRKWKLNSEDPEDAMQDARVALLQALRRSGGQVSNLAGFAFTVIYRHCARKLRQVERAERTRRAVLEWSAEYYAPQTAPKNRAAMVRRALRRLPAETRFALESCFEITQEGRRARRYVCKRLGMSEKQVAKLCLSGMAQLERALR